MKRRVALVVLLIVAAGCSGGGGGGDDAAPQAGDDAAARETPPASSEARSASSNEQPDGSEGGEQDEEEVASPIDEIFGLDPIPLPELHEREEAIAACMKEQGFEYLPFIDPIQLPNEDNPITWILEGRGSEEWALNYGYGISTLHYAQEEVGPDLVGDPKKAQYEEIEDPNLALTTRMDGPQLTAYNDALYGPEIPTTENLDPLDDSIHRAGGCHAEAYHEQHALRAFRRQYAVETDQITEQLTADPRYIEAMQAKDDCMASKGYDFPDGPMAYFRLQLEEINRLVPERGPTKEVASMTEAELAEYQEREASWKIPDEALIALGELQAEEIEVALDEIECDEVSRFPRVLREVRAEYEQVFVDEHEAELLALRDGDTPGS